MTRDTDTSIVGAMAILVLLTGCYAAVGVPDFTPAEHAAQAYIHCSNYWRIHPEQEQDMNDLSAFIGCPTDQGSHCLCADWEAKARKEFEEGNL